MSTPVSGDAEWGAIAFYEAHGFGTVETTDGAGNAEREPDARMAWRSG